MQKADIHPGQDYALREPGADEVQRVRVIEHVRRDKWRVEWVEPNPGLVDFVRSNHLLIAWGQRQAFLRDERHAAELARVNERDFPGDRHPVAAATEEVLNCAGETTHFGLYKGVLRYLPDRLERVAARAGIDPPTHPAGYEDREGTHHLPFSSALALAQAFAAAEPQTVLDSVDAEERRWSLKLRQPGNDHLNSLLADWRASWALVRQWAGHDAAVAAREARIKDLEGLLNQTMWDLRQPQVDPERIANRIGRALGSG